MIVLSEAAGNAMLNTLGGMMDGGRIELLSADEQVLAVLKLSTPATRIADDGQIVFNEIAEEDAALGRGNAQVARVVGPDGGEVFSCDVGDENSDAVVKLNTTSIFRNGPVRIRSFVLAMPKGDEQ